MAQLAVLIINIILLISKNSIEGDRNVNHRSLQSGSLQALQPVNYFGNYPTVEKGNFFRGSSYQPRDHRRPSKKKRKRRPKKQQKKRRPTRKQTKRRLNVYCYYYPRSPSCHGYGKAKGPAEFQTVQPILNITPPPETENLDSPEADNGKDPFDSAFEKFGDQTFIGRFRSLKSKPDPLITPTVEKRTFFQGSRDQARNYPGDLSQNVFDGLHWDSSEYYDDDNYYNDETDRCSLDYPFAYQNGKFCCKTNQELKGGDHRSPKEISSGTCDGIGFSMESTCCKDHDYQECPYPGGCSDYKDRCSQDYPFAYLSGEFCCKTNQELQRGAHRTASEINSGKCDGSGFSRESTCCRDHDYQKCPYQDGCFDYN